MVYGYIRVSTDKQTVDNQRYEIDKFASKNELVIDEYIHETISGSEGIKKRLLGRLLSKLKEGDTLITSELSRLGRSLYMIMDILHLCMEKKIKVITIKDNFILADDIPSKVLAFAFGLSAEIERRLISQRTKEALKRLKDKGIKLGRPLGSRSINKKLYPYMDNIFSYYHNGKSKRWISRKYKVHYHTIDNFLSRYRNEYLSFIAKVEH